MAKKIIKVEGDIAYVPLTQGLNAIIDISDIELISDFSWHAHKTKYSFYASRDASSYKLMHRLIMNAPADFYVDHKDGNGLNNRRSNLRLVTHQQNMLNRRRHQPGLKGTYFDKKKNRWIVQIKIDGKQKKIGSFLNEQDAHQAYVDASQKFHGEFGRAF
jgi:hypothetical protein